MIRTMTELVLNRQAAVLEQVRNRMTAKRPSRKRKMIEVLTEESCKNPGTAMGLVPKTELEENCSHPEMEQSRKMMTVLTEVNRRNPEIAMLIQEQNMRRTSWTGIHRMTEVLIEVNRRYHEIAMLIQEKNMRRMSWTGIHRMTEVLIEVNRRNPEIVMKIQLLKYSHKT